MRPGAHSRLVPAQVSPILLRKPWLQQRGVVFVECCVPAGKPGVRRWIRFHPFALASCPASTRLNGLSCCGKGSVRKLFEHNVHSYLSAWRERALGLAMLPTMSDSAGLARTALCRFGVRRSSRTDQLLEANAHTFSHGGGGAAAPAAAAAAACPARFDPVPGAVVVRVALLEL